MFLDINELAIHKVRIRKSYAPGVIDFHTNDFKQVEPLIVRAVAELMGGQIRITGSLHTRIEMVCARCLEAVRLKDDDTEIGFFDGDGLFLIDILTEQMLLTVPMKVICRSDCRGLCPQCGANMNSEECRCEARSVDPRLAPLARLKQDWFKKQ
jgi:uncharacterized protein